MIPIHLCTTGHRFKQTLYKKNFKTREASGYKQLNTKQI